MAMDLAKTKKQKARMRPQPSPSLLADEPLTLSRQFNTFR